MLEAFIQGIFLAFGLITPLGMQNIFIFNQGALQKKFINALPSILTAALCDTILICLSVLGITAIVWHLPWLQKLILLAGFIFLIYMGFVTWNSKVSDAEQTQKVYTAKQQILFSLSVSLLNPHAIIDSIGVIGTNALRYVGHARLVFTFACILVSWCWFFGLAITGHTLHSMTKSNTWLVILNKISAIIIWIVAVYIGWFLVRQLIS